ncbi:MAG: YybH family protein [Thermomicrobiales bacterium]
MENFDAGVIARTWLADMESCVRAVDYARARTIFAPDVVGFGSRGAMLIGLDALERDQWRQVWGVIRNFTFHVEDLHCGSDGAVVVWLACRWTSEAEGSSGNSTDRPGRMTAVLTRIDDRWVAIHTHHSLAPPSSII